MPSMINETNVLRHGHNHYIADMSDVGLTVKVLSETFGGRYPTILTSDLGNGCNVILVKIEQRDGEVISLHYQQVNGPITIELFND